MRIMLIIMWSVLASALPMAALADNDAPPISLDLVHNVSFDYELFQKEDGSYDCNGTIRFTIKYPNDTNQLIVTRTRWHLTDNDRHFFGLHQTIPFSKEDSEYYFESNKRCSWGTYYKVRMADKDNNWVHSPIFCTNDYISPEDMERIMAPASIDTTEETDVQIRVGNSNNLIVATDRETTVSVYTIDGRCLLSENIAATTTFHMHDVVSGILIVRYTTDNITKIQKLLLR